MNFITDYQTYLSTLSPKIYDEKDDEDNDEIDDEEDEEDDEVLLIQRIGKTKSESHVCKTISSNAKF